MLSCEKVYRVFKNVCSSLLQMKTPSRKNYKPHFNTNLKHYASLYIFCFVFHLNIVFQNLVLLHAGE